jgi:hypothetical protein
MEMALLDTLAVDTLRVGQTEETLLEEGTGTVCEAYSFPFQKAKAMFWRP